MFIPIKYGIIGCFIHFHFLRSYKTSQIRQRLHNMGLSEHLVPGTQHFDTVYYHFLSLKLAFHHLVYVRLILGQTHRRPFHHPE